MQFKKNVNNPRLPASAIQVIIQTKTGVRVLISKIYNNHKFSWFIHTKIFFLCLENEGNCIDHLITRDMPMPTDEQIHKMPRKRNGTRRNTDI